MFEQFVFDDGPRKNTMHAGDIGMAIVTMAHLARRAKTSRAYRRLTGGFLLLRNFSVAISVSPHVCFILVLILISKFQT